MHLPPPQLPAGEQRGPARGRLSHLPVGGEGADQTLQGPQLFSAGGRKRLCASVTHLSSHRLQLRGENSRCYILSVHVLIAPPPPVHHVGWCFKWMSFSLSSPPQNSQPGGGAADGCEGSQLYPPTSPVMLQVNTHVGPLEVLGPTRRRNPRGLLCWKALDSVTFQSHSQRSCLSYFVLLGQSGSEAQFSKELI